MNGGLNIPKLYRRLLKGTLTLPTEKKVKVQTRIRDEFRIHQNESEPSKIIELKKKAESSIGYLKMITPRKTSDRGTTSITYVNGKRVDSCDIRPEDKAKFENRDMESTLKRHHSLMRRQYFMDR